MTEERTLNEIIAEIIFLTESARIDIDEAKKSLQEAQDNLNSIRDMWSSSSVDIDEDFPAPHLDDPRINDLGGKLTNIDKMPF